MREYVGAIHLHSCYSDGSGTLREITAAAARAGIDYLVLTDHDTLRPREDRWDGWHDGVLVLVGVEITCRNRSHVVALGARDVAGLRWKPIRRVLYDLMNQGAAAFVAHAHPAYIMGISLKAGELLDWEVPGFTGVELWSFMHDICHGLTPWRAPSFVYTWRRSIRGAHPDTVAHWDRLTRERRFAAIGALDNHALIVPFLGRKFLSYEEGFRTLRTHVLSQEWTGGPDDAARLTEAICQGRAFLSLDLETDARGFRFEARPPDGQARLPDGQAPREAGTIQMGEERTWSGPVTLAVHSPAPAHLAILRDGAPVAEAEAADLEHTADAPGVYRVEARLKGKPWVYTNPIYLRAPR